MVSYQLSNGHRVVGSQLSVYIAHLGLPQWEIQGLSTCWDLKHFFSIAKQIKIWPLRHEIFGIRNQYLKTHFHHTEERS